MCDASGPHMAPYRFKDTPPPAYLYVPQLKNNVGFKLYQLKETVPCYGDQSTCVTGYNIEAVSIVTGKDGRPVQDVNDYEYYFGGNGRVYFTTPSQKTAECLESGVPLDVVKADGGDCQPFSEKEKACFDSGLIEYDEIVSLRETGGSCVQAICLKEGVSFKDIAESGDACIIGLGIKKLVEQVQLEKWKKENAGLLAASDMLKDKREAMIRSEQCRDFSVVMPKTGPKDILNRGIEDIIRYQMIDRIEMRPMPKAMPVGDMAKMGRPIDMKQGGLFQQMKVKLGGLFKGGESDGGPYMEQEGASDENVSKGACALGHTASGMPLMILALAIVFGRRRGLSLTPK
mgnify:CR=1 FL=1